MNWKHTQDSGSDLFSTVGQCHRGGACWEAGFLCLLLGVKSSIIPYTSSDLMPLSYNSISCKIFPFTVVKIHHHHNNNKVVRVCKFIYCFLLSIEQYISLYLLIIKIYISCHNVVNLDNMLNHQNLHFYSMYLSCI